MKDKELLTKEEWLEKLDKKELITQLFINEFKYGLEPCGEARYDTDILPKAIDLVGSVICELVSILSDTAERTKDFRMSVKAAAKLALKELEYIIEPIIELPHFNKHIKDDSMYKRKYEEK